MSDDALDELEHADGCSAERLEAFTAQAPAGGTVSVARCVDCGAELLMDVGGEELLEDDGAGAYVPAERARDRHGSAVAVGRRPVGALVPELALVALRAERDELVLGAVVRGDGRRANGPVRATREAQCS